MTEQDEPVTEEEEEVFIEYEPELILGPDDLWIKDRDEFCQKYNVMGFDRCEGLTVALVAGRGCVKLADLLKETPPKTLASIK